MEENLRNEIVLRSSDSISIVQNQVDITKKLVLFSNERKIINFFGFYPKILLFLISQDFPLTIELIEKYKNKWNWKGISLNENIKWNIGLILKLKNEIDWIEFQYNKSIPWSNDILEYFFNKLYDYGWYGIQFYSNILEYTELVEKYKTKLDIKILSINRGSTWSAGIIEKFEDEWDWNVLSEHPNIPWTMELVEKYKDKWDWNVLSVNSYLPWSIEFIEKYKDRWDWKGLSKNPGLPWSTELFEKYKQNWDWEEISENPGIFWSLNIYEKYMDKLDLAREQMICTSNCYNLSMDVIVKYEEKWNWYFLSRNSNLQWSNKLIEKYENKWDWKGLSGNHGLPWSIELFKKYEQNWDWDELIENHALPWSIDFFTKYQKKIVSKEIDEYEITNLFKDDRNQNEFGFSYDYGTILRLLPSNKRSRESNFLKVLKSIYQKEIKPFLNEQFIEKIMLKIN